MSVGTDKTVQPNGKEPATMPIIWIIMLVVTTVYAFAAETVFGSFLPFVKTEGGWLAGLVVLTIGTILVLLAMNIIEERKMNAPHGDGHGH